MMEAGGSAIAGLPVLHVNDLNEGDLENDHGTYFT
jgi:hypothetical protein